MKEYQLQGLSWLVNLYEQGINGILADEMGLGKTIQTIAVMAHLAEHEGVWGPFLVVTPSSTLHNWIAEIQKFAPELRVHAFHHSVISSILLLLFISLNSMELVPGLTVLGDAQRAQSVAKVLVSTSSLLS